jgi:hypothetical protein
MCWLFRSVGDRSLSLFRDCNIMSRDWTWATALSLRTWPIDDGAEEDDGRLLIDGEREAWCSWPFRRESWAWLRKQRFWIEDDDQGRASWLRYRDGCAMNFEDQQSWQEHEGCWMNDHDPVEHSYSAEMCDDPAELMTLQHMQSLWRILGNNAPNVAARLRFLEPSTPKRRKYAIVSGTPPKTDAPYFW